jgi:tRNA A-37 threonylcarbamoyl transferase component Bud32
MTASNPCIPTTQTSINGWTLKDKLNIGEKSAVGKVYRACKDDDCEYVIKIMMGKFSIERTIAEVKNQNECAKRGYCLKVEDWWTCKDNGTEIGVIITRLMANTLFRVLQTIPDGPESWKYIKDAIALLQKFHESGMYHGDAHLNNFMFTQDGNLKFIDVEKSGELSDLSLYDRTMKIVLDYGEFLNAIRDKYLPRDSLFYKKVIDEISKLHNDIYDEYRNFAEDNKAFDIRLVEDPEVELFQETSYEKLMGLEEKSSSNVPHSFFSVLDLPNVPSGGVSGGSKDDDEVIFVPWRERSKTGIPSPCRPEKDNYTMKRDCSFTGDPIYTAEEARRKELKPYTSMPYSDNDKNLFNDYLNDLPVYILKKGDTIVHATNLDYMYQYKFRDPSGMTGLDKKIAKECWWKHSFPGQKNYGGGWFTHETSYGGPKYFELFLYYKVQEDIPIFFIPDYSEYVVKGTSNEYIDYNDDDDILGRTEKYSGSHVIQGPKDWKKKGYSSVRKINENNIDGYYFADGISYTLARLGFNGYISCDECEVFLSHEVMKKALTYPYKMDYSTRESDNDLEILVEHCMKQGSPLSVTHMKTRGNPKNEYITLEELTPN